MKKQALVALQEFLAGNGPGHITPTDRLVDLLFPVWPSLSGSEASAMGAHKLQRMESATWAAPVLTFTIERHGAVAGGSINAEVQTWDVDLDAMTAAVVGTATRHVGMQQPRLDVVPIAQEIAARVAQGADDPLFKWSTDHTSVRINTVKALPAASKQTMEARRQRLSAAVETELERLGWVRGRQPGRYQRKASLTEDTTTPPR